MEDEISKYKSILKSSDISNSEKYEACMKLFHIYEDSGNRENGMYYLVRSFHHDKTRIDGIHNLIVHYCCEGQDEIAYNYYTFIKEWYESNYTKDFSGHPDQKLYDFYLPYYMVIVSSRLKKHDTFSFVTKVLSTKKCKDIPLWFIKNLVYNFQFGVEHVDKELLRSYLTFLIDNGYDIQNISSISALERAGILLNIAPKFSTEQCRQSKNILFYTGFANPWWNYTFSIKNALGGSETAVAYLTQCFPKDYTVYVTGEVHEEVVGNVKYVHIRNVQELCDTVPFHTVIISRYIAFFEMFKFCSYKTLVWAHDTSLIHYGCNLNTSQILDKWKHRIDNVICLTEWHKKLFQEYYPQIDEKIVIINNGIKDDLFNMNIPKVPNRFVYTSCSNRGLKRLLELWPQILEKIPDAHLNVASYVPFPSNDDDHKMNEYIQKTPSIKHLGKLGSRELYELMSSSEYWLYPTCWCETSCITALEMLRCGVICIYYPVAGLPYTMEKNGFPVKYGEEIQTILSLTPEQKEEQIKHGKEFVKKCSWMNRYTDYWHPLLFKKELPIKIINLERRNDRKQAMIQKLKSIQINTFDFVKAVDGLKLEPTRDIYEIFKGNDFFYSRGVIGCALSHTNIWKRLLKDTSTDYYIILEDDVEFSKDAKDKLIWSCKQFEEQNLEYLFLGANSLTTNPVQDSSELTIKSHDMTKTINEGAYGYIIHKTAATKFLTYFANNRIKYAHDKVLHYTNSHVVTHIVSNPIVYTDNHMTCKMLGKEIDTDIQHHIHRMSFSSDKMNEENNDDLVKSFFIPDLNNASLAYCDWWSEEYGGGRYDFNDNFLINTVRKYSTKKITVVNPEDNPDVLLYSVFGNTHSKYSAHRKVFYTGESHPARENADFNITFDKDSTKNIRLPIWMCYLDRTLLNERTTPSKRDKFCSFVASNSGKNNTRKHIVETLSTYKTVDCGGNYLNNIGFVVPRGDNASGKIVFSKQYKFALAIENTNTYEGYCTEKICDVFKSGCIPIYWGHPSVTIDFDSRSFINANDFSTLEELVEYVKKVDNDDELYKSYFKYPIFSEYWLNILNDPDNKFFKHLANKIVG